MSESHTKYKDTIGTIKVIEFNHSKLTIIRHGFKFPSVSCLFVLNEDRLPVFMARVQVPLPAKFN